MLLCLLRALLLFSAVYVEPPVLAACRRLSDQPFRPAGDDQSRRQPASAADQAHDPAVHLLWRFVAAGAGAVDGHAAGADPLAARERGAAMSAPVTITTTPRLIDQPVLLAAGGTGDRKSTRLNSSH